MYAPGFWPYGVFSFVVEGACFGFTFDAVFAAGASAVTLGRPAFDSASQDASANIAPATTDADFSQCLKEKIGTLSPVKNKGANCGSDQSSIAWKHVRRFSMTSIVLGNTMCP
jgi:hypothetical protein